jgi:hypothetical protein
MQIKPRDPKKKCIAKKCEDCHHFQPFNFDKLDSKGLPTGLKEVITVCGFDVLYDTIPHLMGAIDGCQRSANETKNSVESFAGAAVKSFQIIAKNTPKLLN